MKQKPTYRFFVQDKDGNSIDIRTLPEEKQKEIGVWAYQQMVKALGYVPVKKPQ